MKFKSLLLLGMIISIAAAAFAQKADPGKPSAPAKLPSAQEILAKYVKAIGGREANEKVKTRVTTGTVELSPMGIKGTFETYSSAADSKSLTKMNLAGIGDILEGYDGKTAWSVNPMQGSREKTGAELAQAKLTANFYRDINLDKIYTKLEVKGIEKVGDKDAYVVVGSAEGVPSETWYFDVTSGLLLRTDSTLVSAEGNQAAKSFIEESRTVDGVVIPVKIRTQTPQFEIIMTATDIKQGVAIDDAKFAKPKP